MIFQAETQVEQIYKAKWFCDIKLRNRYEFGDPAEVKVGIPTLREVAGLSHGRDESQL